MQVPTFFFQLGQPAQTCIWMGMRVLVSLFVLSRYPPHPHKAWHRSRVFPPPAKEQIQGCQEITTLKQIIQPLWRISTDIRVGLELRAVYFRRLGFIFFQTRRFMFPDTYLRNADRRTFFVQ